MCKDQAICEAVCRAAKHFTTADGKPVPMIGAANTLMETTCRRMGIPFIQEVIADLDYDENGDCIISRTHDALDLEALRARILDVLRRGIIRARGSGRVVDLKLTHAPLSLCIHSDTPKASDVAAATRAVVNEFNRESGL